MSKGIPKRPDLLGDFLAKVLAGVNKHQQDVVIPAELLNEVVAAKARLSSQATTVQLSKAQHHKDSQDLRGVTQLVLDVAARARDAVFTKFGHKNKVLEDFGLATPRKKEKGVESAASKVAKANALVARTRAELEKASLRKSRVEALLARREADAAHAAKALPTEPSPSSEPNVSSNGK